MGYRVTAPLVVARQGNGTDVYLYAGSPVPETVGKDELDRLSKGGFIESDGAEKSTSAKSKS